MDFLGGPKPRPNQALWNVGPDRVNTVLKCLMFEVGLNFLRADVLESLFLSVSGAQHLPWKIHEGVVWDPLLLFRSWTSIKIEITWGISGRNLKNWVRFHYLKIWRNWDFALGWLTKIPVTRSIFEIWDSSFGFFLIFMFVRNHI